MCPSPSYGNTYNEYLYHRLFRKEKYENVIAKQMCSTTSCYLVNNNVFHNRKCHECHKVH